MSESKSSEAHRYEITVSGHISGGRVDGFEGLELTLTSEGYTLISGPAMDQAALFGLLIRIRDYGLTLVSVVRQGMAEGSGRQATKEQNNG